MISILYLFFGERSTTRASVVPAMLVGGLIVWFLTRK